MDEEVPSLDVLVALAAATDLGMGQPLGHAARCCLLATGLAEALGVSGPGRSDVFHVALLRYVGCTADAAEIARFAGDEIALAVAVAPHVMGDPQQERDALALTGTAEVKRASITAHCEAAALLATRLGLGDGVGTAMRHGFERWDGLGHPAGLAGPDIPLPVRIAVVARDVDLAARQGGFGAAAAIARARRGRAYDPAVVDAFCAVGDRLLARTADAASDELVAAAPVPVRRKRIDGLLEVLADFADAKLPYALGHTREVARLVAGACAELGMDAPTTTRARRAAMVHDLGRVGVSNRIWDKPGPLSAAEREQVRLHPFLSEQILSRSAALRPLASLAGAHHERCDGSGYYRAVGGAELSDAQQILAAADVYAALRQQRPHRPAPVAEAATAQLREEARCGRLAPRAVAAVLAAAGRPRPARPSVWPADLTDREVQVLRLACRGATKQAVGRALGIAPKTVNRHLESSYAKLGVSSRAAAALSMAGLGLL